MNLPLTYSKTHTNDEMIKPLCELIFSGSIFSPLYISCVAFALEDDKRDAHNAHISCELSMDELLSLDYPKAALDIFPFNY